MSFPTKIGTDKNGYIMKFASKNNINYVYSSTIFQKNQNLKK
ncbi:MAG: hypothetical protein RR835_11395 [Peptostreptococcaceae bacterium]